MDLRGANYRRQHQHGAVGLQQHRREYDCCAARHLRRADLLVGQSWPVSSELAAGGQHLVSSDQLRVGRRPAPHRQLLQLWWRDRHAPAGSRQPQRYMARHGRRRPGFALGLGQRNLGHRPVRYCLEGRHFNPAKLCGGRQSGVPGHRHYDQSHHYAEHDGDPWHLWRDQLDLQLHHFRSGSIAGAGLAVTKAGSGNLTLDVDNTYTGSTLITAGRLVVGNGNNRGTIASSSGITDNGVLEFNRTGSDSYSLVIGGTGSLVKNGSSTLTLSGASTYSGGTTLSSGQLNINNGVDSTHSAIGTGALTISGVCTIDNTSGGGITLNPNMAINMNADFTYVGSSSFNTGTGAHTLGGNRQITVNGSFITLNGVIGDGGNGYSLTKAGSGGILVLAKANTYSGGTILNGGTLYINNATGLGAATGTFTINA